MTVNCERLKSLPPDDFHIVEAFGGKGATKKFMCA